MKKLAIGGVLFLFIMAFFLFGNFNGVDNKVTTTVESGNVELSAQDSNEEKEEEEKVKEEEKVEEEEKKVEEKKEELVSKAVYVDEQYDRDSDKITFQAKLIDSITKEAIVGLQIVEYCDGNVVSDDEYVTDDDGKFSLTFKCSTGLYSWVTVDYNEKTFKSDKVINYADAPRKRSHSSKTLEIVPKPIGAPEFSTVTLALVIIGGCLGLTILRKE
jgi:hypothetical protein